MVISQSLQPGQQELDREGSVSWSCWGQLPGGGGLALGAV